jgi:hypothetical protein
VSLKYLKNLEPIKRMSPENLHLLRKTLKEEEYLYRKRETRRMEKYGEQYYEIFETQPNYIDTPNNPQDDWKFWGKCCYLCRSVLAPDMKGMYQTNTYAHRVESKAYKPHYACFDCRKAWKPTERPPAITDYHETLIIWNPKYSRCSECQKQGTYLGLNCRVPRKQDRKAWKHLEKILQDNPTTFEAKCKCHSTA